MLVVIGGASLNPCFCAASSSSAFVGALCSFVFSSISFTFASKLTPKRSVKKASALVASVTTRIEATPRKWLTRY